MGMWPLASIIIGSCLLDNERLLVFDLQPDA